jgi:hypothetical protein
MPTGTSPLCVCVCVCVCAAWQQEPITDKECTPAQRNAGGCRADFGGCEGMNKKGGYHEGGTPDSVAVSKSASKKRRCSKRPLIKQQWPLCKKDSGQNCDDNLKPTGLGVWNHRISNDQMLLL